MKRLAVIPARGGSKRIQNKNIKDFCGLPMIAHAIKIAQQTDLFTTIHVSTDSKDIVSTATEFGCKPDFERPAELANDQASIMETVSYVVEEYERRGETFDIIIMLYATSPLTDPEDIKLACNAFESSDRKKAYLAVTPFPAPIEHAFFLNDDADLLPYDAKALARRTQDLSHAYYDAGMFAIYSADYIKNSHKAGNFMTFKGYKVPSYRVTDIDWPEDWERAQTLYKLIKTSSSQNGANNDRL